jgi:uncharacterized membrane protein
MGVERFGTSPRKESRIHWETPETRLAWITAIVVAVVVVAAIVTRFTGLDQKFFWLDETQTAMFTAGSTFDDVRVTIYDGRTHATSELMAHQFLRPDRTAADSIRALAVDDPKNPPLYFLTVRAWMALVSPSIAGLRSWSAMLSIVVLAAAFLLARELADDPLAGWVAVGVLAASPLHLIYAQEGRQYMCWLVWVVISSWLLLVAVRRTHEGSPRARWWFALYVLALALAWYSHVLTILVIGAHAIWVLVAERFRFTRVVRSAGVAIAAAGTLCTPWVVVVVRDTRETPAWIPWYASPIPWTEWLQRVVGGFSNAFMDLDSSWLLARDQMLAVIPLLVALWALVRMMRSQSRETRWFLGLLAVACSLPFIVADLMSHGQRATVIRYQLPATVALQIGVAIGIASSLRGPARGRRLTGLLAGLVLAASGFVSISQYKSAGSIWWHKNSAEEVLAAAAIINRSPSPLIVSSVQAEYVYDIFALSHPLADRVRFLMAVRNEIPIIPDGRTEVFLWKVSPGVPRDFTRRGWKVDPLGPGNLYLATKARVATERSLLAMPPPS